MTSPRERTSNMMNRTLFCLVAALTCSRPADAQELKAGAAVEVLAADDAMIIGGGIGPGKANGQEGELRASCVVIEDSRGGRVALVACDVMLIGRDVKDGAARRN
jgi:neutral ceramidase